MLGKGEGKQLKQEWTKMRSWSLVDGEMEGEDAKERKEILKGTWKGKKKPHHLLPKRQCNVVVLSAELCVNLAWVTLGMI